MINATLPPELIDHIISSLAIPTRKLGDVSLDWRDERIVKTDLYSSSLVCREWGELARPHIFRAIDVYLHQSGRITLEAFLEFLNATPRVSHHIRKLSLIFFNPKRADAVNLNTLHTILSCLSHLQKLSLTKYNGHLFHSMPEEWDPTPIHLQHVHCNALDDVFPFLRMLGIVDELIVVNHTTYGYIPHLVSKVSHLKLRSLRVVAYSDVTSFLEGILLTSVVTTIDSLFLKDFATERHCAAAKQLLERVGPRLLDIWIDASSLPSEFSCIYQYTKTDFD
ncbi:hypothetical protein PHLCEN_2v13126 [Hermanssonia centrifuga]|uniref:F-box domain-containing protein n=1 Tax=Hermanssonia centrifuga TaxID=98765 RepID=A0A2R6NGB2_9APHY|nr:hypothetical protein PHLCEN_2v13126 [Hermanssonia centrifuga]